MYIQVLNFYIPSTIAYFLAPLIIVLIQILVVMGILTSIFMFIFREKDTIKKNILKFYFIVSFLIQIFSVYICYVFCNSGNKHIDAIASITFVLVFGIMFLIYYIPALVILLVDFSVTYLKNKGVIKL